MNIALESVSPSPQLVQCAAHLERGAFGEARSAIGWHWGEMLSDDEQQDRLQVIVEELGAEALALLLETTLQEGDFRRGERLVSNFLSRPHASSLPEGSQLLLRALWLQLRLFANGLVEEVLLQAVELARCADETGAARTLARLRVVEADALLLGEQAGLFDSAVRWSAFSALEHAGDLYRSCGLENHAWGVQLKMARSFEKERGTKWAISMCDGVAGAALDNGQPLYAGLALLRKAGFSRKLARYSAAQSEKGQSETGIPWQVGLLIRRGLRFLEQAGSVLLAPLEKLTLLECGGRLTVAELEALREECVRRDYRPGEIETLQRLAVSSRGDVRWVGALLRAAVRSGFCWAQVSARVMLIEGTLRRAEREAAEEEINALGAWHSHPTFGALTTMTTANGFLLLGRPTEAARAARKALSVARRRPDKTIASQSAQLLAAALEAGGSRALARKELRAGIRADREWRLGQQLSAKYQLLCLSLGSDGAACRREGSLRRAGSFARASFRICEQGMHVEREIRGGGDPHPQWLQVQGQLLFFAGDPLGALKVLSQARTAFERLGDSQSMAFLDSMVGYICLEVSNQNGDHQLRSHGSWLLDRASRDLPATATVASEKKEVRRSAEKELSASPLRDRGGKFKVLLQ